MKDKLLSRNKNSKSLIKEVNMAICLVLLDFKFYCPAKNPLLGLINGKLTIFVDVLLLKNGTFEVTEHYFTNSI